MMFKCFSMCSNIYTLEKEMKWTTSAIVCLMQFYTQTWCHLNPISENYSQTLELVKTQILAIDLSRAFLLLMWWATSQNGFLKMEIVSFWF